MNIQDMNRNMSIVGDSTPMDMTLFKRILRIVEEDNGSWFRAITCITDVRVARPEEE